MALSVELNKEIVNFLTSLPNMNDSNGQQAFINSAALDDRLQHLIKFSGSSAQFFQLLVPQLVKYGQLEDGRDALEAILEAAKDYVGQDRRAYCDHLIQNLRTVPNGKEHQLDTPLTNLMAPPPPIPFTGRQSELLKLKSLLLTDCDIRPVFCTGMGGIGKSALISEFVKSYGNLFSDGVVWARLDSETLIDVALNVAMVYGQKIGNITNETQARVIIHSILSNKRVLLVLDNVDDTEAIRRARQLQPISSTIALIVTTRDQSIYGRFGGIRLDIQTFEIKEGVKHFRNVLGADNRLKGNYNILKEIVMLLGGLPLAIDLAARTLERWEDMTISEYLDYLHTLGLSNLRDTTRSVSACLSKSIELLGSFKQSIFITLGVCAKSGFSLETAAAVSDVHNTDMMHLYMREFLDLSMVQKLSGDRFVLHLIVRAFVRSEITSDPTIIRAAQNRHAAYWCSYVNKYNQDSARDWAVLAEEWDGIREAWDWCLEHIRLDDFNEEEASEELLDIYRWTAEIGFSLRYFLDARAHWNEALEKLPRALEASTIFSAKENPEIEFRLRRHLALFLRKTENYEQAASLNHKNIEFAKRFKREDWKGQEFEQLGRVEVRRKNYIAASRYYKDALRLARQFHKSGSRHLAQVLNCIGVLNLRQGKPKQAISYFKKSLTEYEILDHSEGIPGTLAHLGDTYASISKHDTAIYYYVRAINICDTKGRLELNGSNFFRLGEALEQKNKFLDALACYIIATEHSERLGIQGWHGQSAADKKERLILSLGRKAKDFRITVDNPRDQVLANAEKRIQKFIKRFLEAVLEEGQDGGPALRSGKSEHVPAT